MPVVAVATDHKKNPVASTSAALKRSASHPDSDSNCAIAYVQKNAESSSPSSAFVSPSSFWMSVAPAERLARSK